MSEKKTITAEEFDRIFDEGKEDITQYLDLENVRRPGLTPKRVSVDVPYWMVSEIDRQAGLIGVSRQAFIKFTLNEKLKSLASTGK